MLFYSNCIYLGQTEYIISLIIHPPHIFETKLCFKNNKPHTITCTTFWFDRQQNLLIAVISVHVVFVGRWGSISFYMCCAICELNVSTIYLMEQVVHWLFRTYGFDGKTNILHTCFILSWIRHARQSDLWRVLRKIWKTEFVLFTCNSTCVFFLILKYPYNHPMFLVFSWTYKSHCIQTFFCISQIFIIYIVSFIFWN